MSKAAGRKIMTAFTGSSPSASLLHRVRRGEVGGIILFGPNITDRVSHAIAALQRAARAGGNPRLLIATDQEGGDVKRLSAAPPRLAPAQMTALDARREGAATGRALADRGINVDLAPVADVNVRSFLGSRSFGSRPAHVAACACQFATALQAAGVHATFKHFPGLGRATQNTDVSAVTVDVPARGLTADLSPYRRCAAHVALVMLSNATYPALDANDPAVFSTAIVRRLLRRRLGFGGVTISDSLSAPGVASPTSALRASRAGVDILLYADEATSARGYHELLAAIRNGQLSRTSVLASARRIRALTP